MFDDATIAHLHGGCALLLGSVASDGMPHAARAWGCTVLAVDHDAHAAQLRLLVPADDATLHDNLRTTGRISLTTADVPTLRSLQLKGRVVRTEPADRDDAAKLAQYCTDFFTDIHETDGEPWEVLEGWRPLAVGACIVEVSELFDQTPGPSAGTALGGPRR